VLDMSIQIASGLGYAHRSGLVHADVKPQNLLVTREKVVKITDFGIAQALTDTQPQQRAEIVWGSPHYFAPEQARGEPPGPAADVYAIGIVMFEMLTGRLPFSGASQQDLAMAHIQAPIPAVTDFNPTVPESLSKIVQRLMSKEPSQRYQTGSQLEQVLTQLRNQSREYTMRNPLPPVSNSQQAPSAPMQPPPPPVQPQTIVSPVQNRPPGVSIPPAAPVTSEPTARFSAAPSAPQPYNPRQANVPGAQPSVPSPLQPPQPLEQRYTVPAPPQQMRAQGDSGNVSVYGNNQPYGNMGASQPYRPRYEEERLDGVTLALLSLAILAVLGLCPLALLVAGR
jgi:serine/threonine protein kinase